jgi:hypothetical protein
MPPPCEKMNLMSGMRNVVADPHKLMMVRAVLVGYSTQAAEIGAFS